jgi:hypothetical protein
MLAVMVVQDITQPNDISDNIAKTTKQCGCAELPTKLGEGVVIGKNLKSKEIENKEN